MNMAVLAVNGTIRPGGIVVVLIVISGNVSGLYTVIESGSGNVIHFVGLSTTESCVKAANNMRISCILIGVGSSSRNVRMVCASFSNLKRSLSDLRRY